jgi:DNA-binding CsgD family transcriptional regulator
VVTEEQEEQVRYRLLETVRQYALEKLEGSGEGARLRDHHLAYALALVRAAEPGFHGREQVRWMRRLEQAYVNLRAACDWALDRQQWEQGLQLAAGLWPFWEVSGRTAEGCEWLEVILQRTEQAGQTAARGQALLACGSLASQLGEYPLAHTCLEEGLTIFRTQDNPRTLALAFSVFGWYLIYTRDYVRARLVLEESLTLCERAGEERHTLALVLGRLGLAAFGEGQTLQAREYLEQALALFRELGDAFHEANVLIYLGEVTRFEGQAEQAEPLYLEAWRRYQELGHAWRAAMALGNLGCVARARGDFPRAVALNTEALLTNVYRQGSKEHIYGQLIEFGGLALQLGEPNLSARLYGSAEVFHETYGVSLNPADLADYERDLTIFWSQGEKAHLQAAWEEGRTLSLAQAVALVEAFHQAIQAARPAEVTTPPSSASLADLTAREVEVLRLVAQGLTNKQIAQQLVISPKTVNRHLESLFRKLGVTSRAAATRVAVAHKLA